MPVELRAVVLLDAFQAARGLCMGACKDSAARDVLRSPCSAVNQSKSGCAAAPTCVGGGCQGLALPGPRRDPHKRSRLQECGFRVEWGTGLEPAYTAATRNAFQLRGNRAPQCCTDCAGCWIDEPLLRVRPQRCSHCPPRPPWGSPFSPARAKNSLHGGARAARRGGAITRSPPLSPPRARRARPCAWPRRPRRRQSSARRGA